MSDTEMTEKRSSAEFETEESCKQQKSEEVSTEDLEEAMYQVKKSAAKGRAHLVAKAKEHFEARNGFKPNAEELNNVFNTLRDSMLDEDAAQSSSDEEEEDQAEFTKMQSDISSAFEHVRDLGQEAGKKMQEHLKSLWCKENNGGEPSQDETDAVIYNLKHMVVGMVPVESEGQSDDEETYEPSELEKEAHESEQTETADKEEINFDFKSQTEVSEEQFEKLVEKFCAEKGRSPTDAEADALLESFSSKLTGATFDDEEDEDYEQEEDEESEDESCDEAEDKSLETEDMDCDEEEEDEEFSVEEKSDAFTYMKELEEGSEDEEEAEEPSKHEQAQEEASTQEICA